MRWIQVIRYFVRFETGSTGLVVEEALIVVELRCCGKRKLSVEGLIKLFKEADILLLTVWNQV